MISVYTPQTPHASQSIFYASLQCAIKICAIWQVLCLPYTALESTLQSHMDVSHHLAEDALLVMWLQGHME